MSTTTPLNNLQLREYQDATVRFMLERERGIIGDEPGVGKTAPALALQHVIGGRTLIVAPGNAIGVWQKMSREWLGYEPAPFYGFKRDTAVLAGPYVITNYANLNQVKDAQAEWDLVIFDEAHKLKNRRAKTLFLQAKAIKTKRLWLLTGTPVVSGAKDLWTLLNLVDGKKYSSYWTFVKKYAWVEQDIIKGRVVLNASGVKNALALNAELTEYMLRREKKDVLKDLPDKTRTMVPLQMTPRQSKAYAQMEGDLVVELDVLNLDTGDKNWMTAPGILAQMTRLRQLLICPRILGISEDGAAIDALCDEVEDTERPIVVFTPYADALPFIQDRLMKSGYEVRTIRGGLKPELIAETNAWFMNDESPKQRAIVATIKMATGWDAWKATTCYFIGYDWTPANNIQSEDRLHRYGQKNAVEARYLVHEGAIDEQDMNDINSEKVTAAGAILARLQQRARFLQRKASAA